ncbi:MAG: hypothetical protein N3A66_05345 [Planctomycetota bacterium]|nr:hypothetical protein [Planctomycetota bacterium]
MSVIDRRSSLSVIAGMAAAAAVQEMLLHTRRSVNRLFAGVPADWQEAAFENMRTDGAFVVSAWRENGRVAKIAVESPFGGVFRLANPWPGAARVQGRKIRWRGNARVLALPLAAGETAIITEHWR